MPVPPVEAWSRATEELRGAMRRLELRELVVDSNVHVV
jgi:hypothetical protein